MGLGMSWFAVGYVLRSMPVALLCSAYSSLVRLQFRHLAAASASSWWPQLADNPSGIPSVGPS